MTIKYEHQEDQHF